MANEELKKKVSIKKRQIQDENERLTLEKELKNLSQTNKKPSKLLFIGKLCLDFTLWTGKMFMKFGENQSKQLNKNGKVQKKDKKRNSNNKR